MTSVRHPFPSPATVFVYALTPQAQLHQPCHDLLERDARGAIRVYTTVTVAADVLHRAMVLEVLSQVQRSADAVALLKRQPQLVAQLTRYRTILRDLRQARVEILGLTYRDLHASQLYRHQHGLLVNNSLIVAVMQRERVALLATNDVDFECVPGLAVRTPAEEQYQVRDASRGTPSTSEPGDEAHQIPSEKTCDNHPKKHMMEAATGGAMAARRSPRAQ